MVEGAGKCSPCGNAVECVSEAIQIPSTEHPMEIHTESAFDWRRSVCSPNLEQRPKVAGNELILYSNINYKTMLEEFIIVFIVMFSMPGGSYLGHRSVCHRWWTSVHKHT